MLTSHEQKSEHGMATIGYAERLAQHRRAVISLAHQSAKRAVKRQFQAQGVKLHDVTTREISIWAEAWFNAHSAELIAEAKHTIATWPEFARWREPRRHHQITQKPPLKRLRFLVQLLRFSVARAY
jgi:hypothetical protein